MILFNNEIVGILKKDIVGEYLDSVLIATYGFGFQFGDVKIHCNEHIFAKINNSLYEWDDSPNNAPWGLLVRQQLSNVTLSSPSLLRLTFQSKDYVEIETVEGQYESVIINLPSKGGDEIIMEIF